MSEDDMIALQINQLTSLWIGFFLKHDHEPILEKVKCPVLATNGEKNIQVTAEVNLVIIRNSLQKGGNQNITIKSFPRLNHLFQECQTGLLGKYSKIEQTIFPLVLAEITDWILQQVR